MTFGRGPTTPGLRDLLIIVANYLQVMGWSSKYTSLLVTFHTLQPPRLFSIQQETATKLNHNSSVRIFT